MTDENITEPQLKRYSLDPKGVLHKNAKAIMYVGVALLVMVAAIFSSHGKPTTGKTSPDHGQPPQPAVQDNTDNNIQDLKAQLAAERQREAAQQPSSDPSLATPAQRSAAYGPDGQVTPCVPGQPCPQPAPYGYAGTGQQSALQQAAEQIAAKERERSYDSRFASNLIFAYAADTPRRDQTETGEPGHQSTAVQPMMPSPASSLLPSRPVGDLPASAAADKRAKEVNIDAAVGQPYVLYEGTTVDTVLMNRLDGDAVGPVKVLVSNPVYSHDRQHVLVPEGTIVLGEARKIGSSGFGQQRRLALAFHRMIMPDGYCIDLDQFHGLDQIGEEGLKDKVNNHYLEIFGASIALGVIAGAAQISEGGGVYAGSGPQVFTNGASASISQSATTVLDRFMQIPATITIQEGHRVKVYFTQDMLLPAYENHTIPGSF